MYLVPCKYCYFNYVIFCRAICEKNRKSLYLFSTLPDLNNINNTDDTAVGTEGSTGNDSSRTKNWRRIAPSDPGQEVINKNGREWKWCAKCKYWNTGRRAHTTSEHRTKSQRTSESDNTAEQSGEGRLAQVDNIRLMPSLFKLEGSNQKSRAKHFGQAGCFQV